MNTESTKELLINGSQSFVNFNTQNGIIPEGKRHIANTLKELVLFCLLTFEKNETNQKSSVAFAAKDGFIYSNYLGNVHNNPFKDLEVLPGSIISCNFPIRLENLNEIYQRNSEISISGIICPEIDEQCIGFLQKHNKDCFIMADKILSNSRENLSTLLSLNQSLIPKFKAFSGLSFAQMTMLEAEKFFKKE